MMYLEFCEKMKKMHKLDDCAYVIDERLFDTLVNPMYLKDDESCCNSDFIKKNGKTIYLMCKTIKNDFIHVLKGISDILFTM